MNKCVCLINETFIDDVAYIVVDVCKSKAESESSQRRRANEKISEGCVEKNESAGEFGEWAFVIATVFRHVFRNLSNI